MNWQETMFTRDKIDRVRFGLVPTTATKIPTYVLVLVREQAEASYKQGWADGYVAALGPEILGHEEGQ